MQLDRETQDYLILWSRKQGISFKTFCDAVVLKGSSRSSLYLPFGSKERRAAQIRRQTLSVISTPLTLPDDFDASEFLEDHPLFKFTPTTTTTMPSTRNKATSATDIDDITAKLKDTGVSTPRLPKGTHVVYLFEKNRRNESNGHSVRLLTKVQTRDHVHRADALSLRLKPIQVNEKSFEATTGELKVFEIDGTHFQVLLIKQKVNVSMVLDDNSSAEKVSKLQFGKHDAREELHASHYQLDLHEGKYEQEDDGTIWKDVLVAYILPLSIEGVRATWTPFEFNEVIDVDEHGNVTFHETDDPLNGIVQVGISMSAQKLDYNTQADYDAFQNCMDDRERRIMEKAIKKKKFRVPRVMMSIQLLLEGSKTRTGQTTPVRTPPKNSNKIAMNMMMANDSSPESMSG